MRYKTYNMCVTRYTIRIDVLVRFLIRHFEIGYISILTLNELFDKNR